MPNDCSSGQTEHLCTHGESPLAIPMIYFVFFLALDNVDLSLGSCLKSNVCFFLSCIYIGTFSLIFDSKFYLCLLLYSYLYLY